MPSSTNVSYTQTRVRTTEARTVCLTGVRERNTHSGQRHKTYSEHEGDKRDSQFGFLLPSSVTAARLSERLDEPLCDELWYRVVLKH